MQALSYKLKECFNQIPTDAWLVLTVLILHSNIRNRAWPTVKTIANMALNGNETRTIRGKRWLEEHGAYELVPYDKRVSHDDPSHDETKLAVRRHVYQLTGILKINGKTHQYFSLNTSDENGKQKTNTARSTVSNPDTAGTGVLEVNTARDETLTDETLTEGGQSKYSTKVNTSTEVKNLSPDGDADAVEPTPEPEPQPVQETEPEPTPEKQTTSKKKTIPAAQMNPMKDAIVAAFGWDKDKMTRKSWGPVQAAAWDLCDASYKPEDVSGIYAHCKSKFDNFGPVALSTHAHEWQAEKQNGSNGNGTTSRYKDLVLPEQPPIATNIDHRALADAALNGKKDVA